MTKEGIEQAIIGQKVTLILYITTDDKYYDSGEALSKSRMKIVRQEQNKSKFGKFLQNTLSGIRDDILPGTLNIINEHNKQ
ncbi:MAG: hypothetical protein MRQ07_00435 [Candidatus Midichloria sp.]|nr:hypothetical protein [Candidatus Midichloria sp.]